MKEIAPIIVSCLALAVSIITAWLTLFRRGNLHMTRPVLIGFLYDLPQEEPKVFFRALLYATGKRGQIIESMYLRIRRGESAQNFNFWMYGETQKLMIGSGLRVGEEGVSFNHHFLPPKDRSHFQFQPGEYSIEVYARVVNRSAALLLSTITLSLSEDNAFHLRDKTKGILFTYGPDSQRYHADVSQGPIPYYMLGRRGNPDATEANAS